MLSLDLFDSKYEKKLHEGAVDDLEQHRIDVLNDRMQELLTRARTATPDQKASLKQQYEKIKSERDSYYKIREGSVTQTGTGLKHRSTSAYGGGQDSGRGKEFARQKDAMDLTNLNKGLTKRLERSMGIDFDRDTTDEAGIPGNIPKEKIPGKEELLKGRGRTYYESQKKNPEQVEEHGGGIGPRQHWQSMMPEQSDDVEEGLVASGPSKPLDDRAVRKLVWDTMKINADTGEQALQRALAVLAKKPQSRMVQDLQDKFQNLSQRLSQDVAEYSNLKEASDSAPAEQAILKRIMVAHTDLLQQYGPEKVMQAAEEVAYNVGDVSEIGSSDVSGWVNQVQQILGATA